MADLLFEYNIQHVAEIFDEDKSLKSTLINYGLYLSDYSLEEKNPERCELYRNLASLLLASHDFISDRSIDDLWTLQFLVTNINNVFNKVNIVDEELYRQIMFSYKYSTIKHFFRDNFTKFLPSLDATVIEDSDKMNLFQTAFMQEYDRFSDIIDNIVNITDIDKVGNDYLSYLVQILGYEQSDDKLLGKDSFRELAKNIVEVYKIKGTNYSFELFFNFLGFDVELREFYFDKRFADPGISINPYTGSDNPAEFSFYLTPHNPTEYIPKDMKYPHQVMSNQLTDIRSHLWWEQKIIQGCTVSRLLNEDEDNPPMEGFNYEYFKTNIIQYSVNRIRSKETDADELSREDEAIIQAYADFLTPIFITKQVLISIKPFEDVAENLKFTDASLYNFDMGTFVNMFRTSSNWFISDYWIDPDNSDEQTGDLAPMIPVEATDVELNGVDTEEPREYYIWIKTHDHTAVDNFMTKDDMTQIIDNDVSSDEWVPAPNYFKVDLVRVPNTDRDCECEYSLVSVYDLMYTDNRVMFEQVWNLHPYDDNEGYNGIQKILDFDESVFNRVHRLEELNVMSRDWEDWEDFQEVRSIPTFADAVEEGLMTLGQFIVDTNPGGNAYYETTDDEVRLAPWWYYDKLIMKRTTYNFIGFGFVHTSTTVKGELHVERVGGYPPGYTEFEDPIVAFGGVAGTDFTLDIKPIHLGKIKVSGNNITSPIDFDNGNDNAFGLFSAPDIVTEELDVAFIKEYAKLDIFGIYELDIENSDPVAGIFQTLFISSNKNIYSLVEGGTINMKVVGETTVVFEIEPSIATISLSGTYEYDIVFERTPDGIINASGNIDYTFEDFTFPDVSTFALAKTTTPFIRAENSDFLFEDVADFALTIGTGTPLVETLRTVINDFAQGILTAADVKGIIANLIYLSSNAVELSAFYETDNNGEIIDPIFLVDKAIEVYTSGYSLVGLGYIPYIEDKKILVDIASEVENEQVGTVISNIIRILLDVTVSAMIDRLPETDMPYLVASGEFISIFELVKEAQAAIAVLSGDVTYDEFIIEREPEADFSNGIFPSAFTSGSSNKLFELERDASTEVITSGELSIIDDVDIVFARTINGLISASGEINEFDYFDGTTVIADKLIRLRYLAGVLPAIEFDRTETTDYPIAKPRYKNIIADVKTYDYIADDTLELGTTSSNGEAITLPVIERDAFTESIISGSIDIDDFILEREYTGTVVMSADVDGDVADYIDPVIGGYIETYGSANENERFYKYIATTEEGIGFTSGDNVADVIVYDFISSQENGSITLYEDDSPENWNGTIEFVRETSGSISITETDTENEYELIRVLDGNILIIPRINEYTFEINRDGLVTLETSGSIVGEYDLEREFTVIPVITDNTDIAFEIERDTQGSININSNDVTADEFVYNYSSIGSATFAETSSETEFVLERVMEGGQAISSGTSATLQTDIEYFYLSIIGIPALISTTGTVTHDEFTIEREFTGTAFSLGGAGVTENDIEYDFMGQSASPATIGLSGVSENIFELERVAEGGGLTLGTVSGLYELTSGDVVLMTTSGSGESVFEIDRVIDGTASVSGSYERELEMNMTVVIDTLATSYADILAELEGFTFEPDVQGTGLLLGSDIIAENYMEYLALTETVIPVITDNTDITFEVERIGDYPVGTTSGDGEWLYVIERDNPALVSVSGDNVADSATTS